MSNEELVQIIKRGTDSAGNMELYAKKGVIYAVVKKYCYACQSDHNGTPIIGLELIHEAYLGFIRAVENYDASQG